jgi:hypothetical protein
MKKIFFIILSVIAISSCQKVILDTKPLNLITDATLWNDVSNVNKYLANCYQNMKFFNEMSFTGDHFAYLPSPLSEADKLEDVASNACDESVFYQHVTFRPSYRNINSSSWDWWGYSLVRSLNVFIEQISTSPLPETEQKMRLSEARFLRAFAYFNMVKRYGGVPLITKSQKLDDPKEELYPKRAKEVEIWQFIIDELNDIIASNALLEINTGADVGHASKYAALALKSRAAMYAASIATWGTVQLDGIVGVDPGKKDYFWTQSYNASQEIINSGHFQLYTADNDGTHDGYARNFRNLFLVENNSEVIFSEVFDGFSGRGHSWDLWQAPCGYQIWGGGQCSNITLEMVESFENKDDPPGNPSVIPRNGMIFNSPSNPVKWKFWTMEELWGNRDPRFNASVYTCESPWSDGKQKISLDYHKGLLTDKDILLLDAGDYKDGAGHESVPVISFELSKGWPTPFGPLKHLDESIAISPGRGYSKTDWIVFRLGEIYLNLAEAALQLGKGGDAKNAVNVIRERVGMKTFVNIPTLDEVRHERKVELCFEGTRYFDVIRWRSAMKDLSRSRSGLKYVLDYKSTYSGGPRKYALDIIQNVMGVPNEVFAEMYYYWPITLGRTSSNPNLLPENPGY